MKTLLYVIHFISTIYMGAVVMVSIGAHFKGDWARDLLKYVPALKLMNWIWGGILLFLLIFGKNYYNFNEFHGHKAVYFNDYFLSFRALIYFLLSFSTLRFIDKRPYITLIAFFFISNFFSFDWSMSLEKKWFSSIYGLIYMSNGTQAAIAAVTILSFPRLSDKAKIDYVHLLTTAGITWFYMHFSQFIIIWMGNLPRESIFYLERWERWGGLVILIAVFVKVINLSIISLFKNLKLNYFVMSILSVLVLAVSAFEVVWLMRFP